MTTPCLNHVQLTHFLPHLTHTSPHQPANPLSHPGLCPPQRLRATATAEPTQGPQEANQGGAAPARAAPAQLWPLRGEERTGQVSRGSHSSEGMRGGGSESSSWECPVLLAMGQELCVSNGVNPPHDITGHGARAVCPHGRGVNPPRNTADRRAEPCFLVSLGVE